MKNKKIQRILAAALSAQLMVSCMGTAVFAADVGNTFDSDGLTYKVLTEPADNMPGTVQLGDGRGSVSTSQSNVVIPETVKDSDDTYTVVSIAPNAFSNSSGDLNIRSVQIPATVTAIGKSAFSDLTSLTSVTFAEGSQLKSIGDNAFDTTRFSSITLPASLETIGEQAFTKCTYLSSVTMQEGITSIGDGAFSEDSYLSSITLPASLTELGSNVFDSCTRLKTIAVADESTAFSSEDGVLFSKDKSTLVTYPAGKTDADYTVPASVTAVGNYAFANNTKIQNVVLPDGVKTLGKYAFSKATNLTTLNLGTSLETIGTLAFWNCSELKSLTIPVQRKKV